MFPQLCLVTFGIFTTYWLIETICIKLITISKNRRSKQISKIQLHQSPSKQQTTQAVQHEYNQQGNTEQYKVSLPKQHRIESKLTTTSLSQKISSEIPSNHADFNLNQNQQTNQKNVNHLSVQQQNNIEYSMASKSNMLNLAMIEDKNRQQNANQANIQKQNEDHVNQQQPPIKILSEIRKQQEQQALHELNSEDHPMKDMIKQQDIENENSPVILADRQSCFQRRQQRSQLQLLQALCPNKTSQKQQQTNFQIIPQIQIQTKQKQNQNQNQDQNQNQNDLQISKLVQQIDQLFLNNQQQFMKIINKYKVNEARYTNHASQEEKQNIIRLQQQLRKKNQDMDMMEIEISQYKTANQNLEAELAVYRSNINQLNDKLRQKQQQQANHFAQLQQINKKYKQAQAQLQNLKQQNTKLIQTLKLFQQPQPQIQNPQQQPKKSHTNVQLKILQLQLNQKQRQINASKQQILHHRQQISQLNYSLQHANKKYTQNQQLCKNLEKLVEAKNSIILELKKQIENKNRAVQGNQQRKQAYLNGHNQKMTEQMYMKKLGQFQIQIQKIRDQATMQKIKYQQALRNQMIQKQKQKQKQMKLDLINQPQPTYIPISTRQHLPSSQQQRSKNPTTTNIPDLQKQNQNLKNQIQFAQTQIRMFEQSEIAYLKQIQQLEKQIQMQQISKSEIIQLRSKIARMQPIVNQYQVIQRRYFQLKIKYDKLSHQRVKLNNSGKSGDSGKSKQTATIVHPNSPKNNRISMFISESPIQNLTNLGNDIKGNPIGHYRFLFDCAFINLQDRQFVYQTLRNLLKGVLKTQKLYNSKTNKSKNPHELIDNIRGILLIIHLQNDKILGAYTHQSFSSMHPQSSNDNIAFILDITNHRYFTNQSGLNSIAYNPNSLIWGFNQIMLKYEESQVMYTNFCRNHNIYWDGKYRIQQFIGAEKQWARIRQYQIFRVSKI